MPQVLRGDIIESEELAELRDEVLAKLLPAPPRRAQPDEVLAHARAEAHQQAAVFNDSRLAHLQLIHQQHNSLARLQYGDAEADLREAAEAAEVRAQQAAQRTLELIREQEEEDRKARALLAARCSVDSTLHTGVGVSVGAEAACAGSDGAAVRASVGSGRSAKGVKLHASSMAACAAEAPAEITMSRYIVAPAPARFLTTQPPPPPPSQPQEAAPGGAGTGAGGAAAPGAAGPHATHAFYAGSRHASFGRRNSGGSGGMAWHGAPLELPGGGAAVNAPASGGAGGRFVSAVSPWPAELPPSTHGIGAATFSPAAMRSPAPSMRRRSSAADFLLDSVPEVAAMAAKGSGAPSPMLQHLLQNPHQHQQYALHPTPPPPVYLHSGSMAAAATGSGCPSPAPGSATAAGFRSAGTPLAAAHTNSGRGLQHWGSDRQRFGSTSALMAATVAGVVSKAAVAAAQSEAEAEFAADADADVQAAFGGGSEMNTGQSSELDAVVAQVELLQQQRATLHTPPPHQARIHSRPQSHPHQMQAQQGLVGTLASSGCGSASGKRGASLLVDAVSPTGGNGDLVLVLPPLGSAAPDSSSTAIASGGCGAGGGRSSSGNNLQLRRGGSSSVVTIPNVGSSSSFAGAASPAAGASASGSAHPDSAAATMYSGGTAAVATPVAARAHAVAPPPPPAFGSASRRRHSIDMGHHMTAMMSLAAAAATGEEGRGAGLGATSPGHSDRHGNHKEGRERGHGLSKIAAAMREWVHNLPGHSHGHGHGHRRSQDSACKGHGAAQQQQDGRGGGAPRAGLDSATAANFHGSDSHGAEQDEVLQVQPRACHSFTTASLAARTAQQQRPAGFHGNAAGTYERCSLYEAAGGGLGGSSAYGDGGMIGGVGGCGNALEPHQQQLQAAVALGANCSSGSSSSSSRRFLASSSSLRRNTVVMPLPADTHSMSPSPAPACRPRAAAMTGADSATSPGGGGAATAPRFHSFIHRAHQRQSLDEYWLTDAAARQGARINVGGAGGGAGEPAGASSGVGGGAAWGPPPAASAAWAARRLAGADGAGALGGAGADGAGGAGTDGFGRSGGVPDGIMEGGRPSSSPYGSKGGAGGVLNKLLHALHRVQAETEDEREKAREREREKEREKERERQGCKDAI